MTPYSLTFLMKCFMKCSVQNRKPSTGLYHQTRRHVPPPPVLSKQRPYVNRGINHEGVYISTHNDTLQVAGRRKAKTVVSSIFIQLQMTCINTLHVLGSRERERENQS